MIDFITRWAERDPDTRYALLLIAAFVLWGSAGYIAGPMGLAP